MEWLFSQFQELRQEVRSASLRDEVMAALTVTLMSVPQGVAYAIIAGLPPAMGLYAGALPAIVGSLFRSSRHVVTGPTNALALLVGTSVAGAFDDPAAAAVTLALMVGGIQLLAGFLRLGTIVDYVSAAVVTGYITGAGILIGAGQLRNLTGSPGERGNLIEQLSSWVEGLEALHPLSLVVGLATAISILVLRRWFGRSVSAMAAISASLVAAWALDLGGQGVQLVRDLSSVPQGLPPFSLPDPTLVLPLMPVALAGVLLSLVESTSVARSIASRSGQRLELTREFIGTGLANITAGLFSAFPVSGSLSRSALNEQSGATTRLAGAASGVLMLVVLLGLGPIVDLVPVASLAGLLVVVAVDLVDMPRIRRLVRASLSDRLAFAGTLLGTWVLPLDQAIAVGVGINIVLFLRQSQLLVVRELWVDRNQRLIEVDPDDEPPANLFVCSAIRILHLEGPLFFGAAGELDAALQRVVQDPDAKVILVRVKRAHGLDFTTASVLIATHQRLQEQGRTLLLVGMRPNVMQLMRRTGVAEVMQGHLFPTKRGWFVAMNDALAHAMERIGADHDCNQATRRDGTCAIASYLRHHRPETFQSVSDASQHS